MEKLTMQKTVIDVNPSLKPNYNPSCQRDSVPDGSDYWGKAVVHCKSNVPANWKLDMKRQGLHYGLLGALWSAYKSCADVVISPDDLWLTIAQGFATHVNLNAEKLRKQFVEHAGKKDLIVVSLEDPRMAGNWDAIAQAFKEKLKHEVKQNAARTIDCNFSTSGEVESLAAAACSMCTFKKYFRYVVMKAKKKASPPEPKRGIRRVILLGTESDWKLVQSKLAELAKFDLTEWCKTVSKRVLNGIISSFVAKDEKAARFWNNAIKANDHDVSGWAVLLLPYDKEGALVKTDKLSLKNIPDPVVTSEFVVNMGTTPEEFKCVAGFTGIQLEDDGFRSQLSYAILRTGGKKGAKGKREKKAAAKKAKQSAMGKETETKAKAKATKSKKRTAPGK